MAGRQSTLFQQLTRLFKGSGPLVKRKIKQADTRIARGDPTGISSALLLSRTAAGFNAAIAGAGAYNHQERSARLNDYNEMDQYALVNAALDIYADEAVAQDANGRTLHVHSDKPAIKESLEELFYNTLNAEFNIRPWTRNLPVRRDTVIPLLDGRNITIEQLAKEHKEGKENWVYSVQDETHRSVPGRVNWCGLTRSNSNLVRVHLDDGTHVDCTPDHDWVMRDGSKKAANDLRPGDSLMPFYRKVSDRSKGARADGYEQVYDPGSNRYVYTHCRVAEILPEVPLKSGRHRVTHHKDFVKLNNSPSNLVRMDEAEHMELHRQFAIEKLHTPEVTAKRMAGIDRWLRSDEHREAARTQTKKRLADGTLPTWSAYNASELHKEHNVVRSAGMKAMWSDPRVASDKRFQKALKISESKRKVKNHKVDRVEKLIETDDVYCMEVLGPNGEHDRHNFAVLSRKSNGDLNSSGVVLGNCKYGDFYLYIDVSPEYGVINVMPIAVNELVREEGYDPNDPLAFRFRWTNIGNRTLENWEVAHFRLLGNDMFLPYGSSMIDGARRTWRQLVMIEDAMLVYRVTRAVDRRVFYIDVAGQAPDEIPNYMEQAKVALRSQGVIDRNTGKMDMRYAPVSIEDDFWVPTRGGETSTKIDTLPAGNNAAHVEDVEYIKKQLIAALKVPAAYLGYNDAIPGSSGLAQVDIRFSRTVNMIQRTLVSELNKIAMIHLYAAGFRGDDLTNFEIRLSNPSTIAQQQKLDLLRLRFEIAGTAPIIGETSLMSERWMFKNVIGLNDQEILQIRRERLDDARAKGALEAASALADSGNESGGGGAEETPTPDAGGEPELETAADDNRGQGDVISGLKEDESPVKIAPALRTTLVNRRRNQRRKTRFPTINDRAVSGATAVPTIPEQNLREAFEDLYKETVEDMHAQNADTDPEKTHITVKPIFGLAELRMLNKFAEMKNTSVPNSTDWDSQNAAKVLTERYVTTPRIEEKEDPLDFDLYVVEDGDGKVTT
jgi:hypothetical protein